MVSFKDPIVISRDFSMYLVSEAWDTINDRTFNSGRRENSPLPRWSVYVRLTYCPARPGSCNSTVRLQLGICQHPRLRVECHPEASSVSVDDMGV